MTFEERAAVIEQLTAAAHASPRLYRLRVIGWIVLGYAIIGTLLALTFALSAGVIAAIAYARAWVLIKFVWVPLIFAWMLARSMFVRLDAPEGRVLRRHEAPRLFATLDEIRQRARVPRLDGVLLLSTEMNAAVVETPRMGGLFGFHRHLLIGLPMMLTHSTEEMKAILGHELGHLSGQHSRLAGWVYRVRVSWLHLAASNEAQGGSRIVRKVIRWYVDSLLDVTIVQARAQELAADRLAAELTTPETAARALMWHTVADDLLDRRFWEPLGERMATEPNPPMNALHDLARRRAELLAPPFDEVVEKALARTTAIDDTHPSLRDRLQHLGVPNPPIGMSAVSAADELFGRTTASLMSEADQAWRNVIAETWRARYAQAEKARELLASAPAEDTAALDEERLHTRAESLVTLGRNDEAISIYEGIIARNPADARATFELGSLLVQRGDLAGVPHLSNAMERDWRFVVPACELAYSALRAKGLEKDAVIWSERYEQQLELIAEARNEAGKLNTGDELAPTDLPEEVQAVILQRCIATGWIGSVWIARKNLRTLPTTVNFVAVRAKTMSYATEKRFQKLVESLDIEQELMVFLVENTSLVRHLDRVAGARRLIG